MRTNTDVGTNATIDWTRWPWLILALAASAAGWFTIPMLRSAIGSDLEGAYFISAFWGMLSVALTGPLTIITIDQFRLTRRISLIGYLIVLILIGVPALAFQSIAISASCMILFFSSGENARGAASMNVDYAVVFMLLYLTIGLITYPFARAGRVGAVAAAGTVALVLFGFMVLRLLQIIRY